MVSNLLEKHNCRSILTQLDADHPASKAKELPLARKKKGDDANEFSEYDKVSLGHAPEEKDMEGGDKEEQKNGEIQEGDPESYKTYNLFDLFEHIENDCPKTRTCVDCQFEFATIEAFHIHLKFSCEHVKVQCSACDLSIPRSVFRFHQCWLEHGQNTLNDMMKNATGEGSISPRSTSFDMQSEAKLQQLATRNS